MLSYFVEKEIIPCVYDISYRPGEIPCIVISINKDWIDDNLKNKAIESIVNLLMYREYGFETFSFLDSEYFGFDNAIKKGKTKNGFVDYFVEIVPIRKSGENVCAYCKGTGYNKELEMKCSFCDGNKLEIIYDFKPILAISCSLQVLTMLFEDTEKNYNTDKNQLLTFKIDALRKFSISGSYGKEFCYWLNSFKDGRVFPSVIKAMKEVYTRMYKRNDYYGFDAYVNKDAWLIINCPGDACGINPEHYYSRENEGFRFSCHNIDGPAQQLMLLTGLAVLNEMARKEI
ncbi:MAG: hypothetical protein MCSN_2070 [Candidatus Microsyncoccus archaeolyticus]|nr:MAG: hypothetical protein MCSN_2070 [Candidatus Parcubacteria bacterium]